MSGDLKVSDDGSDAVLSEPISECKTGQVTMLIGHSESWLTSVADEITEALKSKELVLATFLDEFQMNLEKHWGSDFRYIELAIVKTQPKIYLT